MEINAFMPVKYKRDDNYKKKVKILQIYIPIVSNVICKLQIEIGITFLNFYIVYF